MDKYKFGNFIYTQRKKLGLTQEELGKKLKVTNKAVSKWETGETIPDITLLEALARILNVTIDELLTQQVPQKIVIKPKKWPFIVLSSICLALIITISILISSSFVNKNDKEYLTIDNINNYVEIIPCNEIQVNGTSVNIKGSIKPLKPINQINININFTIQYYYLNLMDELSEILYIDRYITYNGTDNEFIIELNPKTSISNFKSFSSVDIDYQIKEVTGYYENN